MLEMTSNHWPSVNATAHPLVERLVRDARVLRVGVSRAANGASATGDSDPGASALVDSSVAHEFPLLATGFGLTRDSSRAARFASGTPRSLTVAAGYPTVQTAQGVTCRGCENQPEDPIA
jgi:hypothetical protein